MGPLRSVGACSQDVPVIFGNIELIHSINLDLLGKLNRTLEEGSEQAAGTFNIGVIFCEMANNLLSYDQYCANHEKASERLQKCMKQSAFLSEVEKCRNRMVGTGKLLHLPDLLIKPIQRICKYPLILKELLKFTEKTHPDHIPLLNAITQVELIANKINEHKKEVENLQLLQVIQRHLDGFDVSGGTGNNIFTMNAYEKTKKGKISRTGKILL